MLVSTEYWIRRFVANETFQMGSSDEPDEYAFKGYLFNAETIPALFYMGFLIACDIRPSIVSSRHLDSANVLLHGMWAWRMVTMGDGDFGQTYEWNKYWMLVARLWQGLIFGNARLSSALNSCVVVVDCFVSTYFLAPPQSPRVYISREVGVFCAVSIVLWTFEQIQLAEAKALVSVQTMDTAATLVRGLLSCICDAVVKLDHELRLTEPCPALSALLLRDGPLTLGTQLTDLMLPEDEEHFRCCLSVTSVSGLGEVGEGSNRTFAGLCHVRLRHRLASVLPVNLFFSSMALAAGQVSYLIGIQENCEEGHHSVPDVADGRLAPLSGRTAAFDRLTALPEGSVKLMSHRSSSGFSGSDSGEEADMHVWVDSASPTLTVLNCSRDFALLAGPRGPCRALSEWLSFPDLSKTIKFARRQVPGPVHVRLKPGMPWSFHCSLSVDGVQKMESAPPSSQPVCLIIDSLVCKIDKSSHKVHKNKNLEIWATIDDDVNFHITRTRGGPRQVAAAFHEGSDLVAWVDRASDFYEAMVPILNDLSNGAPNALPRTLGVFTFTSPGQSPMPVHFKAKTTLMDGGETTTGSLYHFCLKIDD